MIDARKTTTATTQSQHQQQQNSNQRERSFAKIRQSIQFFKMLKPAHAIFTVLLFQAAADMNHIRRLMPSSDGDASCTDNCDPTHSRQLPEVTYFPGDMTGGYRADLGLTLSKGLNGKRLTTGGKPVGLANGGVSLEPFHTKADGACTILKSNGDGWYYVSNSEVRDGRIASFSCGRREGSGKGGVGAIEFNAQGEVVGYERLLTGTSTNCGGGRTYWGTWVSCEENDQRGRLYEVDPNTGFTQQIRAVDRGGNYESFAYDNQDPEVPARFFVVRTYIC